jgi:hypothetical protein
MSLLKRKPHHRKVEVEPVAIERIPVPYHHYNRFNFNFTSPENNQLEEFPSRFILEMLLRSRSSCLGYRMAKNIRNDP